MAYHLLRKLVVVGDSDCGKTSLLTVFVTRIFPEKYIPRAFQSWVADVEVVGKQVKLALWDTVGDEKYDRLRPLSYPETEVFLICFAIDAPDSLENVQKKWISEVRHHCPQSPIILVGCKKDLRFDPKTVDIEKLQEVPPPLVTIKQGETMRKKLNIQHKYLECSARTNEGVREVFEAAAYEALMARSRKGRNYIQTLCLIQ